MESYVPIIFHLKEIASFFKRTGKFDVTPEDCYLSNSPTHKNQEKSTNHEVLVSVKPFQPITCCNVCYKSESRYMIHLETIYHKTRLERTCTVCAKYFSSKKALAAHVVMHRGGSLCQKCEVCGKSFNDQRSLASHMKKVHISSFSLKCDMCPFVTWKGSSLVRHQNKGHAPAKSKSPFEPTVCCGTTFKHPCFLKRHKELSCKLMKHTKSHCRICDEYFDGEEALQQHRKDAHEEWICMLCNEKFASNGNLTVHMKAVHIKSTVFECSKCPFSSARKDNLTRHFQNFHSMNKPKLFTCETCCRVFNRKDTLTQHRKTHLKITPLCEICDQSFSSVEELEKHKPSHRPCQICGMRFTGKQLRLRESHMKRHLAGSSIMSQSGLRDEIESSISG